MPSSRAAAMPRVAARGCDRGSVHRAARAKRPAPRHARPHRDPLCRAAGARARAAAGRKAWSRRQRSPSREDRAGAGECAMPRCGSDMRPFRPWRKKPATCKSIPNFRLQADRIGLTTWRCTTSFEHAGTKRARRSAAARPDLLEGARCSRSPRSSQRYPWLRRGAVRRRSSRAVLHRVLASDFSTRTLRRFLRDLGYRHPRLEARGNLGPTPAIVQVHRGRYLSLLRERYGRTVSLIGWIRAAIYARELARRFRPTCARDHVWRALFATSKRVNVPALFFAA